MSVSTDWAGVTVMVLVLLVGVGLVVGGAFALRAARRSSGPRRGVAVAGGAVLLVVGAVVAFLGRFLALLVLSMSSS
ncbi:hypothetical protein ACFUMH_04345 [Cellulomonas sp. NPDC057328]|uniref:hypothetical protein n=1 Tax=Cellulomonas sp. NPDC057328 TaxID=3346101 RepID=UPI0036426C59